MKGCVNMKKILSVTLSVLLFICIFIPVSAEERIIEHADYGIIIDGLTPGSGFDGKADNCFIRNEFYSHFADYYFEEQYNYYKSAYPYWTGELPEDWWLAQKKEFITDSQGNNKTFGSDLSQDEFRNHIFYMTVIFNYDGKPDAAKNKEFADNLSEGMEVLYIGNTTPCAVVAIRGGTADFTNIVENENVEFFFISFKRTEILTVNLTIFEETYTPDSAHARRVLRYAAGLEKVPEDRAKAKEFFFMSDTDYDGKITAADARTALRIAAKLETGHTFYNCDSGCGAWWNF